MMEDEVEKENITFISRGNGSPLDLFFLVFFLGSVHLPFLLSLPSSPLLWPFFLLGFRLAFHWALPFWLGLRFWGGFSFLRSLPFGGGGFVEVFIVIGAHPGFEADGLVARPRPFGVLAARWKKLACFRRGRTSTTDVYVVIVLVIIIAVFGTGGDLDSAGRRGFSLDGGPRRGRAGRSVCAARAG
jgi:hypothetical protein